jgi:hypothetical protein
MARFRAIGRAIDGGTAILIALLFAAGCSKSADLDEAQKSGREATSFPQAEDDYFRDMDNGVPLNTEETRGRNMWILWTGGNDRFWDKITEPSLGTFDLLKIVSSHPLLKYNRDSRWRWLGAVNEPCFDKPTGPDRERFGLWLDVRRKDCRPILSRTRKNIPA